MHKYIILIFLLACNSKPKSTPVTEIPLIRDTVSKAAVASYSEKVKNPLNDWKFEVQLFETPATFSYLMTIGFEEMKEKDTLRFPNLGFTPKPAIRKGEEEYSCIIGFVDNENNFLEYKKVIASNNHLKVTTLKRYGLYEKPAKK